MAVLIIELFTAVSVVATPSAANKKLILLERASPNKVSIAVFVAVLAYVPSLPSIKEVVCTVL